MSLVGALAQPTYRAAYVEHTAIIGSESPRGASTLALNTAKYVEYVAEAAQLGVDIIVFPEYGLTGFGYGQYAGMHDLSCASLTLTASIWTWQAGCRPELSKPSQRSERRMPSLATTPPVLFATPPAWWRSAARHALTMFQS